VESYNTTVVSTFTGGIDTDTADRYVKEGDYRALKNGTIERTNGGRFAVKKIKSTKLLCDLNVNPEPEEE
jgi:hypothetical protein